MTEAFAKAEALNRDLDIWRRAGDNPDASSIGTLHWLFAQYKASAAFERLSERTKPDYIHILNLISEMATKTDKRVGQFLVSSVDVTAVDKIYDRLAAPAPDRVTKTGKILKANGKPRLRQAELAMTIAARAWGIAHRAYPKIVPAENPFRGVQKLKRETETYAATRDESYALSDAITDLGHPALALVPLICFEWLQRPENVLSGHFAWSHWRPNDKPNQVQIVHHKTKLKIWHWLIDPETDVPFYPDLEQRLQKLKKIAPPVVARLDRDGKAVLYKRRHAHAIVAEARRHAGLNARVTLKACERGGATEFGDSAVTEQQFMATSGHKTPSAARLYVKKTESQRLAAARKRQAWRLQKSEQNNNKSRNEEVERVGMKRQKTR